MIPITFVASFPGQRNCRLRLLHAARRPRSTRKSNTRNLLCVARSPPPDDLNEPLQTTVPKFSEIASGEWFGYEAAFSSRTGSALSIEDRFVPDAYREWGVEIMGFDTVTSTQVTNVIYQKRTRALPSVGCEADAVIPDTLTRIYENYFGFKDGSFCNGPYNLTEAAEWGFTLVDPSDPRSRARIEFGPLRCEPIKTESLDWNDFNVTVRIERREADFCDGQVLPGCGGTGRFATEKSKDPCNLDGTWHVQSEGYVGNRSWQFLETSNVFTRVGAKSKISVMLPRGLSLAICRGDASVCVAVGWLHSNVRVEVRREYDQDGSLLSVSRELQIRQE